jgi:hypothetical protein
LSGELVSNTQEEQVQELVKHDRLSIPILRIDLTEKIKYGFQLLRQPFDAFGWRRSCILR